MVESYWNTRESKYLPLATPRGSLRVTNSQYKIRDGFETINLDNWDIVTGNGDLVSLEGNTAGSGYLKISKSTDKEDTDTYLLSKFIVDSPVRFGLGMSISQRLQSQRFSFGIVGVDDDGNVISEVTFAPPVNMANISQAATTLTINTQTPHGFVPGDRIVVSGVSDSRANYGEVYVATVVSPTSLTVTATPTATIPSQTIAQINNSGTVQKIDPFMQANNALGIFWEGTNTSNAKMISRTAKGPVLNSIETYMGNAHTNAAQPINTGFADSFNPTHMLDIRYKMEGVIARAFPMDSTSPQGGMIKRTQAIPEIASGYKIRIRARNNKAMTRPIATILNAVKSGTTTTTITTAAPHNLAMGDYVQLYGIRDQVNFANLTTATAVASIIDATTFTIAMGAAFTGNARGGVVIDVHGTFTIAPIAQAVQSIAVSGGLMTVIGNATWAGFSIGDTLDLKGVIDTGGAAFPIYEGAYKVANISTTTLTLYAPNLADVGTINVGGALIKRTDFRLHLLRAFDYTRHTVEMDGSVGNISDYQEAMPVNMVNFSSTTVGQAANDAVVAGNPVRTAAKAQTVNAVVSASGDVVDNVATLTGAVIGKPYSIPESDWNYAGSTIANTDVVLKAALLSNRNYLTGMQIMNTGTPTEIVIKDGINVIWRGFAPTNVPIDTRFNSPLKTTANTALNFQCITASTTVYISAQGYQAP